MRCRAIWKNKISQNIEIFCFFAAVRLESEASIKRAFPVPSFQQDAPPVLSGGIKCAILFEWISSWMKFSILGHRASALHNLIVGIVDEMTLHQSLFTE